MYSNHDSAWSFIADIKTAITQNSCGPLNLIPYLSYSISCSVRPSCLSLSTLSTSSSLATNWDSVCRPLISLASGWYTTAGVKSLAPLNALLNLKEGHLMVRTYFYIPSSIGLAYSWKYKQLVHTSLNFELTLLVLHSKQEPGYEANFIF